MLCNTMKLNVKTALTFTHYTTVYTAVCKGLRHTGQGLEQAFTQIHSLVRVDTAARIGASVCKCVKATFNPYAQRVKPLHMTV